MNPSSVTRSGICGRPRGAGPPVFAIVVATVAPPPTPPEVVSVFTVADPIAPTPARAAPPTTPLTKRRRPDSAGYLSDLLIGAVRDGPVKRVTKRRTDRRFA